MKIINLCTILFLSLILILSGCSKESSALEEFKKSSVAQEINQCVGVNGSVAWKMFQPLDNNNPDVRVIEALLTKGSNNFEMQWLYNLNSKISELAFAGKSGEKTNRLMMGMQLGIFCMQKFSDNKINKVDNEPKSDMGDSEKLKNLEKNGSDGWGNAQSLFTGNIFSYLLINPNQPNNFRYVKYIECRPDPHYQIKLGWDKFCNGHPNWYRIIISDEIQSMTSIYKIIDEYETNSEYKDKSEITSKMNSLGWRNVKQYYLLGHCKDKSFATVRDFYNFSLDGKIKRLTSCNGVVIKDVEMNPFDAEAEYFKSGMYQGH